MPSFLTWTLFRCQSAQEIVRYRWQVDYVITHCAAANVQYRLMPTYDNDRLTRFLFDVERRLDYRAWFFGHYHENKRVGERQIAVYGDIWEIVLGQSPDDDELVLVREG